MVGRRYLQYIGNRFLRPGVCARKNLNRYGTPVVKPHATLLNVLARVILQSWRSWCWNSNLDLIKLESKQTVMMIGRKQ
ncbi:MAG: hypothetical protein PVH26_11415, partial [Desulfosarcina sp.]